MRKILPYILIALALLIGQGLLAQSGVLRDKVQEELDRTDQLIAQAEEQLQSMENPAGLAFLEQAKVTQQQAKDLFAGNQFVEARRMTLLARDLLRKALRTNRATELGSDQALRKLEQVEDKLERARELLAESENQPLTALLDVATDNLKRAWDFYTAGKFIPAIKLAEQVEKTADRILSRGGSGSAANYQRRLETVREAIDQAGEVVEGCQMEDGRSFLDQAVKALESAEQLADKGQTRAALQMLQKAKVFAARAMRACETGDENLAARYQRLLGLADQLKEQSQSLSGDNREAVDLLLTKAYEQLEIARTAIDAADVAKATPALQAANLAIRQAEEIILESN